MNAIKYVIFGAKKALSLLHFDRDFMYLNVCLVGNTVSPERLTSYCNLIILSCNYSSFSTCLNANLDKLYWSSPFVTLIWGALSWIIMERIVQPETSWALVVITFYSCGATEEFMQVLFISCTKIYCQRNPKIFLFQV